MKIFLKVFVAGVVTSFVFGVIGGIAGAFLSGVIAFPDIGHAAGYESGAMIIGAIGMVLGGTLGSWLALPRIQKTEMFLVPTGIVVVLALILVCGFAIIEASFDDIPRYFFDGINLAVLMIMPFIIARRAMRSSIVS